jgi:hypothetical protein
MNSKVATATADRHPVLPDIGRPRMAKVHVQTPDIAQWNELLGQAIQRTVLYVGWSNKEAAAKVGVDDAEFGKWLSGGRRPQFDKLFAVPELREPLCVFLSQMAGAVIKTQIEFERRTA